MRDPQALRLGGTRHRATMLFADIRGFTEIAARLSADKVVELLNQYFAVAVDAVHAYDGLLDKFYGDGLLAVFGPPRSRDDDARRALLTAKRLHDEVERLNPLLARRSRSRSVSRPATSSQGTSEARRAPTTR